MLPAPDTHDTAPAETPDWLPPAAPLPMRLQRLEPRAEAAPGPVRALTAAFFRA